VFTIAGDFGHIAGIFAGFAAVIFSIRYGTTTSGMSALFDFR
jgi:hypothetical protein